MVSLLIESERPWCCLLWQLVLQCNKLSNLTASNLELKRRKPFESVISSIKTNWSNRFSDRSVCVGGHMKWLLWNVLCVIEYTFLYQMIIWYLVVCPGSFTLTSLHTGHFSERSLQNSFWKSLYMKLSIFPRYTFFYFFQKLCIFSVIFIKLNIHEFVMSSWQV